MPTAVAAGLYFSGTATTATTGPHIANLTVQSISPPTPNCQISNAYVTSSGQSVAFFFATTGGTQVYPNVLNYAPAFYRNGSFLAAGVPSWVINTANVNCACALFALPAPVLATDVVTVTAPASWMSCGAGKATGSVAGYTLTNYTGQSCFGTDTLTKTFKPGFNISDCIDVTGPLFLLKNLRYRMPASAFSGGVSAWTIDGAPATLGTNPVVIKFIDLTNSSSIAGDATQTPGVPGYYALSYDDNAYGTSNQCNLTLVSPNTAQSVVSQDSTCTGVTNSGTSGIGQYAMFKLAAASGSTVANLPIAVQYNMPSFSAGVNCTPNISNLTIYGPGDFSYTSGLPLSFVPPTIPALSNFVSSHLPYGVGVLRFIDSLLGSGDAGNCNLAEPWELRGLTDFSFNNSLRANYTISLTTVRALTTANSPYFYGDGFGSSWTATATLAANMTSTQTTLTLSGTGDAIFYGIMLKIDNEYMRCTSISSTTVTVVRRRLSTERSQRPPPMRAGPRSRWGIVGPGGRLPVSMAETGRFSSSSRRPRTVSRAGRILTMPDRTQA